MLFKTHCERFFDMDQPPVQLADRIDQSGLRVQTETPFSPEVRPGAPSRIKLSMPILKSVENLSDKELFVR